MTALESPQPMTAYRQTERTTPARLPERATYDAEAINAVLDEALVCHVAYVHDGKPAMIPTLHVRRDDGLYIHGSTGSRLMLAARSGPVPVCITVTLVDGLVMARSWFHHSINYRSVIIHGDATMVTDKDEKWDAMVALMEHIAPGRADGSRGANSREFAATAILRIPLDEVSMKHRAGMPNDDEEDLELPHWAGVIPVTTGFGPLQSDGELAIPDYLANYGRGRRNGAS
jgi:nitroimidazol reductase NimA-like FMN-containing flavoprotein (pyridoxamine 5'-phosphate oxidase superfamily)